MAMTTPHQKIVSIMSVPIMPCFATVVRVVALGERLLIDRATGDKFGLPDLRDSERCARSRQEAAVHARVGYAVTIRVSPAHESDAALGADLRLDGSGGQQLRELGRRFADFVSPLLNGLTEFQSGVTRHLHSPPLELGT